MPVFDSATGTLMLPWWAGLAALALLAVLGVFAFLQSGLRQTIGTIARYAVVFAVLILAAGAIERFAERDRTAERRALDARIGELSLRAVAPGSPLACLDGIAGEAVETACEKALFASPETIAAAVAYVSARVRWLADFAELAKTSKTGAADNNIVLSLRRALESDRFGLLAHLLSYRDNCTPAVCDAFSLLGDPNRIAANMRERTFDLLVERHAAAWPGGAAIPENPALPAAPAASTPAAGGSGTSSHTSATYDFPSASSIPPVSIMNAEPSGTPAANAAEPDKNSSARKPAPAAVRRNGQKPGTPVPLAPPSAPAAANTPPASAVR